MLDAFKTRLLSYRRALGPARGGVIELELYPLFGRGLYPSFHARLFEHPRQDSGLYKSTLSLQIGPVPSKWVFH